MRITSIKLFAFSIVFFAMTNITLAQSPCVPGSRTGNGPCSGSPTLTGGGGGATLQSMLADIYGAFDSYIIPFLVTIAFIAFLINVIRYFIWKSDSEDGRESARRYLVWSLIGFVIIVAMWGIINLIILFFGFGTFGGIVCPDYDPNCNPSGITIGATPTPGGGFTGGGPSVPTGGSGVSSGGFNDPTVGGGTSGGLGTPGGSDTTPGIPGTSTGDYSSVGAGVQSRVATTLGTPNTFLSNQLANISAANIADDSRLVTALSFANAGAITQPELSQIVVDVNQVRQSVGLQPIPLSSTLTNTAYVNTVRVIYQNIPVLRTHIVNYYISNGRPAATAQTLADADMQNIFRTNNTFATRVNTAADIMANVMEGDPAHPAFIPLLLALNAESGYAGCNVNINSTNLFQAPCG